MSGAQPQPHAVLQRPSFAVVRRSQRRRFSRGSWLLLAIAAAVAVYWSFAGRGPGEPAGPGASVPVAVVRAGDLARTTRLTGYTTSHNVATMLAPYLRGRRGRKDKKYTLVLERLAPAGKPVRRGEVIAEFDPLYMLDRLDIYENLVDRRQASVEALAARLETKFERHEQKLLVARGRVDKAALDRKTSPVRSAIAAERFRLNHEEARVRLEQLAQESAYVEASEGSALRLAELNLQEARTEARRARDNVERLRVRAPIDGVVVPRRIYKAGDTRTIRSGDRLGSGQPFMQIMDLSSITIDAQANQVDSQRLRINAPAEVRFDAYSDLRLPARVSSVGTYAKQSRRGGDHLARIPVQLVLEETDPRLLPHLTVSAEVVLAEERNATIVPRSAVFPEATGAVFAYVSTPEGWEKRELELGLGNNIDVVARRGLDAGETVVLRLPALTPEPKGR